MTTRDKVRIATGAVYFVAGLPKFVAFDWERDAFVDFGLPFPEVLVILAGVIEIGGGIALLTQRWLWPSYALLSATMAVAIVSSGVLNGDVIPSLTVAPALLAATVYLAVTQAGGRRAPARA